MSNRLTRKEIKKSDPIAEALFNVVDTYQSNQRMVLQMGGLVVLVVGLFIGFFYFKGKYESDAATAFAKAQNILEAQVDPSLKMPSGDVYPSEESRDRAALAAFAKFDSQHGKIFGLFRSPKSADAAYLRGMLYQRLGSLDASAQAFENAMNQASKDGLIYLAKFALAETRRAQKRPADALVLLDEVSKAQVPPVSSETLVYTRALCLREANRTKEAVELLAATVKRLEDEAKAGKQGGGSMMLDTLKNLKETMEAGIGS